jgi:type IV pilus assembly protein PilP
MGPVRTAALAAGVAVFLGGCGSDRPASSPAPKPIAPVAKAEPKKAVPTPVEASQPQPAPAETFVYSSAGLRDPFEPFIKLETEKKDKPKVFVPQTPLQRYTVDELRLVGVIWSGGAGAKPKALIEDPAGKGYVVTVGTLVGDKGGGIVKIGPDEVVVEERFVGVLGEENQRIVKMALHKPEGEVKK